MTAAQPWVAELSYPGKPRFYWGTVVTARGAELEAERLLSAQLREHLPDGWQIHAVLPGMVIVKLEDSK